MKLTILTGLCAVALAATSSSRASLAGLEESPLGDRSASRIEFALWDLFPAATFTNLATPAGDLGITLSQSISATAPYGPQPGAVANDLFYTFNKASAWTLAGTASADIAAVALQIKLSTPASGTLAEFFTTTLNGVGAAPVLVASGIEPGGLAGAGYHILRWTWSDPGIESGEAFVVNFSSPVGNYHVALDAIAVDVAAVPEPAAYGFAAALFLVAVVIWHRRRQPAL